MINLLPPETKASYRYARYNAILVKWLVGLVIGVVGIAVVIIYGELTLNQTSKSVNGSVGNIQTKLAAQKLDQVKSQVSDISSNLKLMVNVLSQEVLFSQLLKQVGSVMPSGTVLTQFDISGVKGGINLQAGAVNYQAASQIQVNLEDPANKLFSKADIESISCGSGSGSGFNSTTTTINSKYPCQADIRALFVNKNPFLFINQSTSNGAN